MTSFPAPFLDNRRLATGALAARRRGFVLPVVLVMIVIMTTVVLFTVRRGTLDAQLAGNDSRRTINDSATEYVLRYCELWVATSLPGATARSGYAQPPVVIDAPARDKDPAWRDGGNWTDKSVALADDLRDANIQHGQCLIEDASAELADSAGGGGRFLSNNETATDGGVGPNSSRDLFRKFRITARVSGKVAGGARTNYAQSEVRLYVGR